MTNDNIQTISVHELKKRRDTTKDLCLIDVRELDEWQEMHIPGALHLPKDTVCACIETHVPDRNQPIYLHCRGGVRSLYAAQQLAAIGYTQLYSVDGGIAQWQACGYPVVIG